MSPDLKAFQNGVQDYWREIGRRSLAAQNREHAFLELASQFARRQPPSFTRAELTLIMEWKHTDARWRDRALRGLSDVTDEHLTKLTSPIANHDLNILLPLMRGEISGVGIASVSAILTAARPDRFCVIDEFALNAVKFHYSPEWLRQGRDGKFVLDEKTYISYVKLCRKQAEALTNSSGELWTPRQVEMAFWAIGKSLGAAHACSA